MKCTTNADVNHLDLATTLKINNSAKIDTSARISWKVDSFSALWNSLSYKET